MEPPQKKVKHSNAGYYCCVLCCRNRSSSDQSLHFHRFPSQKGRRSLWLRAIRREVGRNFAITSNTRVCSAHFKPTDYFRSNEGIVSRLQPGAVPTEFSWSPRKTPTPRRVLVRELPVSKKVRLTSCDSEGDGDGDVFSFNVAIVTPLPSADHDYCITSVDEAVRGADSCALFQLQRENTSIAERVSDLVSRSLTIEALKDDARKFKHYTGLPNYEVFCVLCEYLKPKALRLRWWRGSETMQALCKPCKESKKSKTACQRQARCKLSVEEQFFLVLVRLRTSASVLDLSHRASISPSTFSKLFTTWINFLAYELKLFMAFLPATQEYW